MIRSKVKEGTGMTVTATKERRGKRGATNRAAPKVDRQKPTLEEALGRFWSGDDGHWRLLNISEEEWTELAEIARKRGCHEDQLPGLRALLGALADLYRMAACGETEAVYRDVTSEAERTRIDRRFNEKRSQIALVVGRFFRAFVPSYTLTPEGVKQAWLPVPGWNLRDEAVPAPSLFAALGNPLSKLLDGPLKASALSLIHI